MNPCRHREPALAGAVLERAREAPDRPAVIGESIALTYAQLVDRSAGLARHLTGLGYRPGDRVAVIGEREPELVVGVLACLLGGFGMAVVDSAYPGRRIERMLAALEPAVVLTGSSGLPCDSSAERVALSAPVPLGGSRPPPHPRPDADYYAFTSGTTGRPKVVRGGHRAIAHFVDWYTDRYEVGESCRTALLSGLSHDPLWRDVLVPLSVGGAVCVPTLGTWLRPGKLAGWIRDLGVTDLCATPGMARRLFDSATGAFTALRRLVLGGEPVLWADVRCFTAAAPGARIVTTYGATETPQIAVLHEPELTAAETGSGLVPLGTAAPGFELRLCDPEGGTVRGAGTGEIVLRSRFLAAGYLGPDQGGFRIRDGVPEYATGDLARRGPDGELVFRGRADRSFKVRGVRVESAEIEALIRELREVRDARVVFDADRNRLYAFVRPVEAVELEPRSIRRHLAALLPVAAIPDEIVPRDDFPLTRNGKVDSDSMLAEHRWHGARL